MTPRKTAADSDGSPSWEALVVEAFEGERREFQKRLQHASMEEIAQALGLWEARAGQRSRPWTVGLTVMLESLGKAAAARGVGVEDARAPARGKRRPLGASAWDLLGEVPDDARRRGVALEWAEGGLAPLSGWKKMERWHLAYPGRAERMLDEESSAKEMGLAWIEHGSASGVASLGQFCARRPMAVEAAKKGFESALEEFVRSLEDWTVDSPTPRRMELFKDRLIQGFGRVHGPKIFAPWAQAAEKARVEREVADGWLAACACAFASDNPRLAKMALSEAAALDGRCLRRAGRRLDASRMAVAGLWSMATARGAWRCVEELARAGAWIGCGEDKGVLDRESAKMLTSMRDQAAMGGERKEQARQAFESAGRRLVFELESSGMPRQDAVGLVEKASQANRRPVGSKRASEKDRLAMGFTLALSGQEGAEQAVAPKRPGPRL